MPSYDSVVRAFTSLGHDLEPKTYKEALTQSCWIAAMQEELNEFERLEVWELVPRPDQVMTGLWIQITPIMYKLKKALYGLKQAPRAWYDMLSSFLLSQDFSKGSVDPTLFIRRDGNELLRMSMMGKISFFFGLQIFQSPRGIFINQSKYALESLKKYGFEFCDPVDTPMVEKSKLDEDREGKAVDPSHYCDADHAGCQDTRRSTSGSVQFLEERLISWSSKRQKSAAISRLWQPQLSNKWHWMRLLFPAHKGCELEEATSDYHRTFNQRNPLCKSSMMFCADVPSSRRSLLLQMYLKFTCRNSGLQLMFINTPSDSKLGNKKHIVNLETFRDMLHIYPRIPGQSFDELPFEEEILEFLRFLGHSAQIRTLTDVNINKLFQPWRSFGAVINKCLTGKSSGFDSFRKRSGLDTSITLPTAITTLTTTVVVAPRLTAAVKSKQPAKAKSPFDPSELGGSGTDEGTGSKPGVPDVPSNDSEEEISWNSSDDEDADAQEKDRDNDEGDEKDESRDDDEESKSDEESDDEETREEESFDPIPRTPKDSEDDGNDEEDQGLRISEEERLNEEEEADELYRDVEINQGRGLPLSQDIEDSYVTLTPVNPDGQQESSLVSLQFMTSMLNPTSDAGTEDELKKILIEKIEGNKSIQLSDEQRNLYKALVEAYEVDKIILDTYGETVTLKRRRDDESDKDEGPFDGSDRGSRRRREGKEPESASAPLQTATRSAGRSTTGSKSRQASVSAEDQPIVQSSQHPKWFSQPKKPLTPDHTPLDFSNFIMNRLRVDTLTPKLLAGPTYELMKGSCKSLTELEYHWEEAYKDMTDQLDWVNPKGQQYPHNLLQPLLLIPDNRGRRIIPFAHFINNDLEYLQGGASSRKYTTFVTKTKATDYRNIKWIEDLVLRSMWIQEPINYDKHAFWGVSHWRRKRQQFYGYKHLDWITVRRDDDKLYKFKEGNFKRLRLQDIEDMLLLLVQGKLSNLTVEEQFAFNVSLRMFTRNIVIQRRKRIMPIQTQEDSSTKTRTRKNRLMRIDELQKFSDGTLNDVRNALDDRLKRIRMQYLPQTIWRKGDKDRAAAMIQAIDKMLKTRRIMRSLERFVGGRLYEGDFCMLQRTI
nr:hypothetical protein [Tanacetum cinerariifolium]